MWTLFAHEHLYGFSYWHWPSIFLPFARNMYIPALLSLARRFMQKHARVYSCTHYLRVQNKAIKNLNISRLNGWWRRRGSRIAPIHTSQFSCSLAPSLPFAVISMHSIYILCTIFTYIISAILPFGLCVVFRVLCFARCSFNQYKTFFYFKS